VGVFGDRFTVDLLERRDLLFDGIVDLLSELFDARQALWFLIVEKHAARDRTVARLLDVWR